MPDGCLLAVASRVLAATQCCVTAVVPEYRCGAVPGSHRVPSCPSPAVPRSPAAQWCCVAAARGELRVLGRWPCWGEPAHAPYTGSTRRRHPHILCPARFGGIVRKTGARPRRGGSHGARGPAAPAPRDGHEWSSRQSSCPFVAVSADSGSAPPLAHSVRRGRVSAAPTSATTAKPSSTASGHHRSPPSSAESRTCSMASTA